MAKRYDHHLTSMRGIKNPMNWSLKQLQGYASSMSVFANGTIANMGSPGATPTHSKKADTVDLHGRHVMPVSSSLA